MLVVDQGNEKEAIIRLARVGYDYVAGFLDGGINAWEGDVSTIHDVSTEEAVELIKSQSKLILDVRNPEVVISIRMVRNTLDYKNYPADLVNLIKMHLLLFIVQEVIAQ